MLKTINSAALLGFGSPLLDFLHEGSDALIEKYKIVKGGMTLVDYIRSQQIIEDISKDKKVKMSPGGSTGNVVKAMAHLGSQASFFGKIGNDKLGQSLINGMTAEGVDSKLITADKDDIGTGCVVSIITPDSERSFATYLGAAIHLSAEDIKEEIFEGYNYVFIEGYLVNNPELFRAICKNAAKMNCKVALDLASFNVVEENISIFKEIIPTYVDIVFANEEEAKAYTGKEPAEALEMLAAQTDIAIVKIGAEGSLIARESDRVKTESKKVKAIDTTGAGDFYAGGFMHGLAKGLSLQQCSRIGSLLGSEVVQIIGTQLSTEIWEKICREVQLIKEDFKHHL